MVEPIVFISRNRVKEGLFEAFREHYHDSVPPIEAGKPGTAAQLAYFDEAASEVVVVRLFASAEALDRHLQGVDERSKAAYRFVEPTRIEIYGAPNEDALKMMTRVAGSGIEIRVNPTFIGGFIRPQSG